MFPDFLQPVLTITRARAAAMAVILALAAATALPMAAQSTPQTQPQQPSGQQPPQKPQQQVPEAGGPEGDVGPIVLPKKKDEPPPPPPPKPKTPAGMPSYTITKDVPVVTLPVLVTTKDGQFIPGLKSGNFKVMEDGVPQQIATFSQAEAPVTAVLLVEFANTAWYNQQYMIDALNAGYTFASTLKKDDWVAVVEFDMKPQILVDFTQDKNAIYGALNQLRIPGFSETNVFDALYDTLDRVDRIDGRKYVILISSGCDSFSKITYDKILKKVKDTPNVGIFSISTGEAIRLYLDSRGYGDRPGMMPCTMGYSRMDFLQADNQMATFARMTGGRWYKPRFEGEFPEIMRDIAASIRNEYMISYHPTNPKLDGSYRKLKVQLVGPDGQPLKVKDQKGKDVKYVVIAREGYTAKHEVE